MTCLGDTDAIDRLLAAVREAGRFAGLEVSSVSLPAASATLLHRHFTVGDGGDWEWMWTTTAPPVMPGEAGLVALAARDLPEVAGPARGRQPDHARAAR